MVLPYTTVSGNVMTAWVLILLSTHEYISEQGGIVDAVLLLVCEIWMKKRPAYCTYRVCPLLQASARARMHGDEATADGIVVWCWCCCGLGQHARTHNPPLGRGVYVEGRSRLRRPWLSTLSQRRRRLQQTNATSQRIQRGYTAPPALCAGPRSAASIAPQRQIAQAVSLCLASATALGGTSHVSTAVRSRRLPYQSPSPILKQSLSISNLISLTLLLAKAVIGPSLSKMSLRIGAVPHTSMCLPAKYHTRYLALQQRLFCAGWNYVAIHFCKAVRVF